MGAVAALWYGAQTAKLFAPWAGQEVEGYEYYGQLANDPEFVARFLRPLEDAMSRQAQAERERQARIILGTAETDIAAKFAEASMVYINNPVALHLRAMNMLYEAIKEKGSMVIVPSSAVETMGLGGLLGTASLSSQKQ